jgi:hypothetical protein
MDAKMLSEVVRNYFQIIAILVAAVWTIYVFYGKEAPLLERRLDIKRDLRFEDGLRPETCRAIFNVSFENSGVRAIDIKKLRIRAWRIPAVEVPMANATYYDFTTDLTTANLITNKFYPDTGLAADEINPFIGHYPAGVGYSHSFEWHLPKLPGQLFYTRVDFFRELDETTTPWIGAAWAPIACEKAGN